MPISLTLFSGYKTFDNCGSFSVILTDEQNNLIFVALAVFLNMHSARYFGFWEDGKELGVFSFSKLLFPAC